MDSDNIPVKHKIDEVVLSLSQLFFSATGYIMNEHEFERFRDIVNTQYHLEMLEEARQDALKQEEDNG